MSALSYFFLFIFSLFAHLSTIYIQLHFNKIFNGVYQTKDKTSKDNSWYLNVKKKNA